MTLSNSVRYLQLGTAIIPFAGNGLTNDNGDNVIYYITVK